MCLLAALLAALITNGTELNAKLLARTDGDTFAITGTVTYVGPQELPTFFFLEDGTGAITIHSHHPTHVPRPGDRVAVTGYTACYSYDFSHAIETNVCRIASGPAPTPCRMTVADITVGRGDNRVVKVAGRVYASFLDEIDSNFHWLALEGEGQNVPVAISLNESYKREDLPRREDRVELICICRRIVQSSRRLVNRYLAVSSPHDIKILSRRAASPFDCPLLEPYDNADPQTLVNLPPRKIIGRVLATWQGNRLLMESDSGLYHTITLAEPRLPASGAKIEVVGIVETDLYTINLDEAVWQPATDPAPPNVNTTTEDVTIGTLLTDPHGKPGINYRYHGKTVRIKGMVVGSQHGTGGRDVVSLSSDGYVLTIDASSSPTALEGVDVGCLIEASGVVTVQTGNWQPNRIYPRTIGTQLVLREPQDLRILSRPSWWTPLRLMLVIGALGLALIVLFIWNRILNRLVERRSRQLAQKEISRDLARLKTEERTRLAVELHDTIAQNLTGVALQLDAVELAAANAPAEVPSRLKLTKHRLQNSRDELRNVLWDLRSRAFEERLLAVAIRRTIAPHIGTAQVDIDCNISNHHLSDNAIHQLLSIVRELVVNAVRHGDAKRIVIRGELSSSRINLDVSDDGKGFDPETHPGAESGHFGLQGLSERVHLLEGAIQFTSAPGRGTVVRLTNLRTDI